MIKKKSKRGRILSSVISLGLENRRNLRKKRKKLNHNLQKTQIKVVVLKIHLKISLGQEHQRKINPLCLQSRNRKQKMRILKIHIIERWARQQIKQ